MAKIRKSNSSGFRNVIFKSGMMIEEPGEIDLVCEDIAYAFFSALFFVIFIAFIIISIVSRNWGFLIVSGIAWIIYQIMSKCNR